MSLVNYTLPFGSIQAPAWATVSPLHSQHASAVNNLLYGPAGHQEADPNDHEFYKNSPYSPPQQQQQKQSNPPQQSSQQYRQAPRNNYLPPPQSYPQHQNTQRQQQPAYQQPQPSPRTYGEGSYSQVPSRAGGNQQQQPQQNNGFYNPSYNQQQPPVSYNVPQSPPQNTYRNNPPQQVPQKQQPPLSNRVPPPPINSGRGISSTSAGSAVPERPPGFVKVNAGQGSRTQVHAVLDYDDDEGDYYDDDEDGGSDRVPDNRKNPRMPTVTPIQGPIFVKNGTVPVVPLFAYPQVSNGTFVQIPFGQPQMWDFRHFIRTPRSYRFCPTPSPRLPSSATCRTNLLTENNLAMAVLEELRPLALVETKPAIEGQIWWTALSVALGLNVRGDVIKGVPCVKKNHQLFCPTAGNTYPIDKIETFIDENKALMKRMYGDFEMTSRYPPLQQPGQTGGRKRKRHLRGTDDPFTILPELMDLYGVPGSPDEPNLNANGGESYFGKLRKKRQNTGRNGSSGSGSGSGSGAGSGNGNGSSRTNGRQTSSDNSGESTGRVDACESKIEIVTPYWASNSAGKVRAIVNTQHFEQAIHQEVCSKTQTSRCSGDCGCEQKYKWHRLLAYDPDNDCKGIFMDWFLFPSCCVCRCNP